MVMGFNTEVEHRGVVFHVQTEPRKDARIETLVYLNGAIIHSLKTSYLDFVGLEDFDDDMLKQLVEQQHLHVIVQIRADEITPPGAPAVGAESGD